jgi:hypothetical protein
MGRGTSVWIHMRDIIKTLVERKAEMLRHHSRIDTLVA